MTRARTSTGAGALWGRTLLLGIILLWCLFPFFWLIMTSLKIGDRALNSPNLFQGPFGLQNYIAVFSQDFHLNLRNSFAVAGMTTILCVIVGSLAAYAIARLPLKRKLLWLSGVLAVSLFPPVALVPPLYEVWRTLGLLNTWEGLYIPYTSFTLPLTIFILTTFFAAIPRDLEEAAKMDGATPFQAFYKIIFPLAAPGVFAAAIIIFVSAWNEFLLASTFAPRNAEVAQTVPVAIAAFTGAVEFQRPIGTITAACVVVTIPMIIMALIFQRRIVSGLTAGAVKG
ncbi:carbohydrate ABC transporter permease [Nesterenkonia massiliensis]|uniref:Carbohydrate ABC transporter permease n=1 Tax=Nesterenkonia massiliensis TaxID=1232429 RepID=A0ABT2HSH5_9MICC|nr:carbohydrate ABC transporter permease [Nesterenkonia massiliensis]MCT1607645.1 carbohydrate ABC transporter permease [Nesterenkonia massiliensis]